MSNRLAFPFVFGTSCGKIHDNRLQFKGRWDELQGNDSGIHVYRDSSDAWRCYDTSRVGTSSLDQAIQQKKSWTSSEKGATISREVMSTRRTFSNMIYYYAAGSNKFRDWNKKIGYPQSKEYLQALISMMKVMRRNLERLETAEDINLQISCDPYWLIPLPPEDDSDKKKGKKKSDDQADEDPWPQPRYRDARDQTLQEAISESEAPENAKEVGHESDSPADQEQEHPKETPRTEDQHIVSIPNGLDGFKRSPQNGRIEIAMRLPPMNGPFDNVIILNKYLQSRWETSYRLQNMYRMPYKYLTSEPIPSIVRQHTRGFWIVPSETYELDDLMTHHLSAQLLRALGSVRDIMVDSNLGTRVLSLAHIVRPSQNDGSAAGWHSQPIYIPVQDFETIVNLAKRQPQGGASQAPPEYRESSTGYAEEQSPEEKDFFQQLTKTEEFIPYDSITSEFSFQYLVVALYLSRWDWSQGYNQRLIGADLGNSLNVRDIFPSDPASSHQRAKPGSKPRKTQKPSQKEGEDEEDSGDEEGSGDEEEIGRGDASGNEGEGEGEDEGEGGIDIDREIAHALFEGEGGGVFQDPRWGEIDFDEDGAGPQGEGGEHGLGMDPEEGAPGPSGSRFAIRR